MKLNCLIVLIQCQIFKDYIENIIKKQEQLPTHPAIQIYMNRVNIRLVFKIKDVYRLFVINK